MKCGFFKFFVAFILVFNVFGAGHAQGVKVESDNFILVGDIKAKNAELLVNDLEVFRSAVFSLLSQESQPEYVKVKILAVKNEKQMKDVLGFGVFDGVYLATYEGPYFVLNAEDGFKRGEQARHIALHEYVHHMFSAYTDLHYPRWYNEGFAEYLATFEDNKGVISVGRPVKNHAYALASEYWMDWDILLGSVFKYPFRKAVSSKPGVVTDQNLFYAQSWLAVHYINSAPGYNSKFAEYMRLLNQGVAPAKAFEQGFGLSQQAFGQRLKDYYETNKFQYLKIEELDRSTHNSARTSKISRTELQAEFIDFALQFSSVDNPKLDHVRALISDYERLENTRVETLFFKARLKFLENDHVGALETVDQYLQVTDNPHAHYLKGKLILEHNLRANGFLSEANKKESRKHLKKMLLWNSDHPGAHIYYARTHNGSWDVPPAQVTASAKYALSYVQSPEASAPVLILAQILVASGDYDQAQDAINYVKLWSGSPSMKRNASEIEKVLERYRKTYPNP